MEENISKYYYEQLGSSTNPGQVLSKFYTEITGKESGRPEIIQINRLIKLFGKYTLFFAILELNNYNIDVPPFGLLFRICQRRFERENPTTVSPALQPLDKYLSDLDKEIEKKSAKKIVIPDSSKLGEIKDEG